MPVVSTRRGAGPAETALAEAMTGYLVDPATRRAGRSRHHPPARPGAPSRVGEAGRARVPALVLGTTMAATFDAALKNLL